MTRPNPLDALSPVAIPPVVMFNTGTFYDLMSGDFQKGHDGKWYCRGGLGPFVTAIVGRGNTYKSTMGDSFIGRSMAIYPETTGAIFDTETIKDVARFNRCSGELGLCADATRIIIQSGASIDLGSVWEQIKALGAFKLKNQKDLMVETPWVDPFTGKRITTWAQTMVFIDALTTLISKEEEQLIAAGLDAKEVKTMWFLDGNKKAALLRHIRPAAERFGLSVVMCAAVGGSMNIDPMSRPTKPLQFMKQGDSTKGGSPQLLTIPRNFIQTMGASTLTSKTASGTEPEYPNETDSPLTDLNEVSIALFRGKNNCAGNITPLVVSQTDGLQNDLTHYHYLRRNNYFGLLGNQVNHRPAFTGDLSVNRRSFRAKAASDPALRRSVELCAHLLYVRQNWAMPNEIRSLFAVEPEELAKRIEKAPAAVRNEILGSRSYWTTAETDQPYLSIIDVLEILTK